MYYKEPLEKTTEEVITQMMFGSVANISPKEKELLSYLFSKKGSAEYIVGRYLPSHPCV